MRPFGPFAFWGPERAVTAFARFYGQEYGRGRDRGTRRFSQIRFPAPRYPNRWRHHKMKPGDEVTVYVDPITRRQPEGAAELLERTDAADGWPWEVWEVRFPEDGPGAYRVSRRIVPESD